MDRIVTRNRAQLERDAMTMHYTLMSHGKVLGHTAAAFPPEELPAGASVWHLVPSAAFDSVEPIIAELTAPPAIALVEEVIPTQDPAWREHDAQMERLAHEAARIHHFRVVLERYEALDLELRDASGRRLATTSIIDHEADGDRRRTACVHGSGRSPGSAPGGHFRAVLPADGAARERVGRVGRLTLRAARLAATQWRCRRGD
jgi:hypothetical protein